ncbi:hypothetical protein O3P69_005446 [Scylla paramamosain]|uniref:Uncharacterized protein n=1 Tax=Scylla paramamosain TaxID=85552 RepID=A0AAW0U8M9_SCYPA
MAINRVAVTSRGLMTSPIRRGGNWEWLDSRLKTRLSQDTAAHRLFDLAWQMVYTLPSEARRDQQVISAGVESNGLVGLEAVLKEMDWMENPGASQPNGVSAELGLQSSWMEWRMNPGASQLSSKPELHISPALVGDGLVLS